MEHAELGVAIASNMMRKSRMRVILPTLHNVAYPFPTLLVEELAVIEEKLIKGILAGWDWIHPSTCQAVGLGKVDVALVAVKYT
jgi:hypothetical protein